MLAAGSVFPEASLFPLLRGHAGFPAEHRDKVVIIRKYAFGCDPGEGMRGRIVEHPFCLFNAQGTDLLRDTASVELL